MAVADEFIGIRAEFFQDRVQQAIRQEVRDILLGEVKGDAFKNMSRYVQSSDLRPVYQIGEYLLAESIIGSRAIKPNKTLHLVWVVEQCGCLIEYSSQSVFQTVPDMRRAGSQMTDYGGRVMRINASAYCSRADGVKNRGQLRFNIGDLII